MNKFSTWLEERFAKNYCGIKDTYEGAYDAWLSQLDGEEYIELGNQFAEELLLGKELIKQ